jgi:hypothetical protein
MRSVSTKIEFKSSRQVVRLKRFCIWIQSDLCWQIKFHYGFSIASLFGTVVKAVWNWVDYRRFHHLGGLEVMDNPKRKLPIKSGVTTIHCNIDPNNMRSLDIDSNNKNLQFFCLQICVMWIFFLWIFAWYCNSFPYTMHLKKY